MTANQKTVVEWLKGRVSAGCGYIMGATGQVCTKAFREQQAHQYASYDGDPSYGKTMIMGIGAKWDGKNVYDCQAIVRLAYEKVGIMVKSGATTQYKNALQSYEKVAPISEMPAGGIAGAQLWRQSKTNAAVMSHTAVCIGDGKLIEAASTRTGVVISNIGTGYAFYGVPKGLLDTKSNTIILPNEVYDPQMPTNNNTIAIVSASSVNLRYTPNGEYVFKIPHGADIEITEQRVVDGKLYGFTEYAAPYGRYAGDLYKGWIEMQYVTIVLEGGTIPPDTNGNTIVDNPVDNESPVYPDGEMPSDDVQYYAWNYLQTVCKLSPEATAGIMGNIQAESAWKSNNLQNTANTILGMTDEQYTTAVNNGSYTNFTKDGFGYGLCQWTHWTRKALLLSMSKERNISIDAVVLQLDLLWNELHDYPAVLKVLQKDGVTVGEASNAFMTGYEKPTNTSDENKKKREALAYVIYNKYMGGVG